MKIERIILFTKGIETLSFFSEQLGKTFSKLGYEVFYFDQCKSYDSLAELLLFAKPEATAAVTFNFDGCCGEGYFIDCRGIHLFDDRKIPVINIVVDHPFYYHKFLPFLPKDYCQISIDREHEAYLQYYFPEIKRGLFLPLAGTSLWEDDTLPKWEERPYDVVFTGNYTPLSKFEPTIERHGKEYADFYYGIIEDFKKHPHLGMDIGIREHLLPRLRILPKTEPRRAHPPSVARGRRESCCPSRPARARRSRALERDRADTEKASARRPPASPSQRANSPRAQRGREARASPRTESLLDNRRSTKPPSQLFGTGSRSPL